MKWLATAALFLACVWGAVSVSGAPVTQTCSLRWGSTTLVNYGSISRDECLAKVGITPSPTPIATATPTSTPAPQPTATPTSGYLFRDEFDTFDANAWVPVQRDGDPSGGEKQCYLAANDAVSAGVLKLTTKPDPTGCTVTGTSWTQSSGMVQWRSFNYLYGKLEVRALMPGGVGQIPAIWMLGTNCQPNNPFNANDPACNWPNPGAQEIDVAEILGSDYRTINEQIHTATSNQQCQPTMDAPATTANTWLTYRLDWHPGSLVWTVDLNGTTYTLCTITGAAVPNTPMFLIINAGQGYAAGNLNPVTSPKTMQVDFVRVSP